MTVAPEIINYFKPTDDGLVPQDWKSSKFGNIVKFSKGRKPKSLSDDYDKELKPYLTADYFRSRIPKQFVNKSERDSYVEVESEDVVLIWDGSNAGDVFTGLKGVLASTMVRIEPLNETIEKEHIYYYLKTQFLLLNSKTTGSTIPHVNKEVIQSLNVLIPPLPEQKKIASVLSALQEAKEKTENVLSALKELKKSMMKHLFTYGAVPIEKIGSVNLKETEIGLMPEKWDKEKIGNLCDVTTGTTPSTENHQYYDGNNLFIKTAEIKNNVISNSIAKISDKAIQDYNLKIYPAGSVFMAMYGQGKTRGQVALLNVPASTSQNTAAMVPKDKLMSSYFWLYLMSQYEKLRAEGIQGHISHLNLGFVKQIEMPVPPLEEQKAISIALLSLFEKIDAEENRRLALDALFKTLLSLLMTGKMRVNNLEI
jgi:type I restriction enzyme S subunit